MNELIAGHCGLSGVFLSEWIAGRAQPNPADHDHAGAENSVQQIGTCDVSEKKKTDMHDPRPVGSAFNIRDFGDVDVLPVPKLLARYAAM